MFNVIRNWFRKQHAELAALELGYLPEDVAVALADDQQVAQLAAYWNGQPIPVWPPAGYWSDRMDAAVQAEETTVG